MGTTTPVACLTTASATKQPHGASTLVLYLGQPLYRAAAGCQVTDVDVSERQSKRHATRSTAKSRFWCSDDLGGLIDSYSGGGGTVSLAEDSEKWEQRLKV